MSKIKFCALGGLGENGKNLYLVTVDDKIFILDAGIKYPSVDLYGIDAVMPDFTYLIENKDKIACVILTHGHEENCGAIAELLKNINIPVYGSKFTIAIVNQILIENNLDVKDYMLLSVDDSFVLTYDKTSVSFFYTSHSIPETFGVSINTEDGSVVYVPDFSFGFTKDSHYQTSFSKLNNVKDCLLLCPESLGVNNINRVNNDYTFNHMVNDALRNPNRVVFAMYSYDLNRIQKVVDLCVAANRKIAVIGRKVQRIINVSMNEGYLNVPNENLVNLKFIDENNTNNDSNLAVIITGVRHEPYFMLQRMMTNQDKLIKLTEEDVVVTICPPVIGTEKIATRALDQLSKTGSKVVNLTKDIIKSSHADSEDLKMIYQMLKPKYICPVIGEYRHQYMHKNIALEAGYAENQVIVLDNGQEITFDNGKLLDNSVSIEVGDVLVDGSIVGDINEVVLKDREQLSLEGAMIIVTNIDARNSKIISGPKVYTKGFTSMCDQDLLYSAIELKTKEIIERTFVNEFIDWNQLKTDIKDNCTKEVRTLAKKSPIIIPVIIDINEDEL